MNKYFNNSALIKRVEKRLKEYPLYSQENTKDPLVLAKIFNPCGSATWYLTEYNAETKVAFGYAIISEKEWGYISIDELASYINPSLGLPLEIDLHFDPIHFSKIDL